MNIILIFIIAVSLSMDAFSLSIAYGTMSMKKREISTLSLIVGLYHFFMPIIGMLIGRFVLSILHLNTDIIILIIFGFIGINMMLESFKENKIHKMNIIEMIFFGFAVSIDSFSIGIGINSITNNIFICALIFSVVSFLFTNIGLRLGNKLNQLIGAVSTFIGGITLIILGIIYVL